MDDRDQTAHDHGDDCIELVPDDEPSSTATKLAPWPGNTELHHLCIGRTRSKCQQTGGMLVRNTPSIELTDTRRNELRYGG